MSRRISMLVLLLGVATLALAQSSPKPPAKKEPDKPPLHPPSANLPPAKPALPTDFPPPKSPAEALASMKVRPGLKIELAVAEPLVMDPVDIAWGPDGRLWVVEMADYPLGLDGKGKPGGRVRFLEDTNGDGRYDRSTVFLEGVPFPSGIMPWRRGVLVTAAPHVLYAEDTDGDGKADVQRPLFTGFGEGNQQHRVNGLRWGLDNWVYLANGDSDGKVRSAKTGQEVSIRGRDLRIRPDEGLLDPQSGRTQFGRNRDDWGHWFGCNNSNPMWHFALEDHYLRRNPYFVPPKPTIMVSIAPGASPVFPISQTLTRFNDFDKANRFTSACGTMVYRDELLGSAFVGNAFICEPVHNLVHREVMAPQGTTFTSRRAEDEAKSEFLASSDSWFRPTTIHTGPDGALWVVDMYRHVIEHPQWIPLEWQARLDLRAGHDRGRIYRIVPADAKPRPIPRLDKLSAAELVAALDSPSGWQRDMAQQLLVWRGDRSAIEPLRVLAGASQRPLARLHALCTLDGLGALRAEDVRRALSDDCPGIRRHALRLSEPFLATTPGLNDALPRLVNDADLQVRMQLAYSLGYSKDARAGRALASLAAKDSTDEYLVAAVFSSLHEGNISDVLVGVLAARGPKGPSASLIERLLRIAGNLSDERALKRALETVCTPEQGKFASWQLAALAGFLEALESRKGPREQLLDGPARAQIGKLFAHARTLAIRSDAPEAERLLAVQLLARALEGEKEIPLLTGLLTPRHSPAIQQAALASLGRLPFESVPQRLLADWDAFSPALRVLAIDTLLGRDAWARLLLAHIEQGKMPAGQLDAACRQRLLQHRDPALRQLAVKVLAGSVSPDRKKLVEQFEKALTTKGNSEAGRQVFRQRCASCHQLEGHGHAVGPDLAALADKSAKVMLLAVLDPNQAIEDRYVAYVAAARDGRTFSGVLATETGTSITLRGPDGKDQVILRNQLEELRSTGKSLMPEGLEKDVTVEQMADLLAYLAGFRPGPKPR